MNNRVYCYYLFIFYKSDNVNSVKRGIKWLELYHVHAQKIFKKSNQINKFYLSHNPRGEENDILSQQSTNITPIEGQTSPQITTIFWPSFLTPWRVGESMILFIKKSLFFLGPLIVELISLFTIAKSCMELKNFKIVIINYFYSILILLTIDSNFNHIRLLLFSISSKIHLICYLE